MGRFVDAMECHTKRLSIVLPAELGCGCAPPEPIFAIVHGERYIRPSALREFLTFQTARRPRFEVTTYRLMRVEQGIDERLES
jgi:hypothetical protein